MFISCQQYVAAQQADDQRAKPRTDSVLVIGQVLEGETFTGLPFAHVRVGNKATTTDFKGLFKTRVNAGDTISISYVGFKTSGLTVPDNLPGSFFETKVVLEKDTVLLENANITILPSSVEAFKQAILSLNLSEQEYRNVEKNMEAMTKQISIYDYSKYSMDASENQRAAMRGPQSFNFMEVIRKVKGALTDADRSKNDTPPPPPPVYYHTTAPDPLSGNDSIPLLRPDSIPVLRSDSVQVINN